jgi:hypothetical protein
MPRNGSGTFTLVTGNPVVSGTIIESTWANSTLADIADSITNSLARNGEGGMTAALRLTDGVVGTPSLAFANETSSGLYRAAAGDLGLAVLGNRILRLQAAGASVTGTLNVSSTASIGGDIDVNGAVFRQQAAGTGYLVYGSNGATNNGLYYDQANSAVSLWTVSNQRLIIDSSGNVGIGTSSPNSKLHVNTGGVTTSAGGITLRNAANQAHYWYLSDNVTSTFEVGSGAGVFRWINGNGELMRITPSGNLLVGTTSGTAKVNINNTGSGGSYVTQSSAGGYNFVSNALPLSSVYYHIQFLQSGTPVGSILSSGSSTSYNTSSDYRLKENVAPMTGALEKVAALNPVTYTWKADGSAGQGFIAHELQAVVPDCVTGEKDAIEIVDDFDAEGKKIGTKEVPRYQGVDTSFLVATLVAAIQELNAKVEALESIPAA